MSADEIVALPGIVPGDARSILRTISNIPAGRTIASTTIEIKDFQFSTVPTAGIPVLTGAVTDNGASGTGAVRHDLDSTHTSLLIPRKTYWFFIHVVLDDGTPYTPCMGTLPALSGGALG